MNILLVEKSHDGPVWTAFNFNSLNLELEHHKNLHDAILLCLENKELASEFSENKKFGPIFSVAHDKITQDFSFANYMLRGDCEFSDEEAEEYDPRYTNITIQPPFQVDIIIEVISYD